MKNILKEGDLVRLKSDDKEAPLMTIDEISEMLNKVRCVYSDKNGVRHAEIFNMKALKIIEQDEPI